MFPNPVLLAIVFVILYKKVYKIRFWTPGIGYERGIGRNFTASFDLSLAPYAHLNGSSGAPATLYWAEGIRGRIQFRYFYNFKNRAALGRNTSGNSGNYFAADFRASRIIFDVHNESENKTSYRWGYVTGITWGIQRTYKSNIFINAELGLDYYLGASSKYTLPIEPHLSFTIGYLLFRNR